MNIRLLLGVLALGLFCVFGVAAVSITKYQADAAELERWGVDPNNPPDLDDIEFAKSQLSVPADLTDADIEAMVERLFVAEDWRMNYLKLSLVGRRAIPMLLEALDDPRITTTEFPLRLEYSGLTTLHRVTRLLEPFGPPEAAKAYSRLAFNEIPFVRSRAGEALGNIGTAECVKPVLFVMSDQELMLRLMTVRGIADGLEAGRATPEFLEGVFPAVLTFPASLREEENGLDLELAVESAILSLRINQDEALKKIRSSSLWSSSDSFVSQVMEAISSEEFTLPNELIVSWIEEIEGRHSTDDIASEIYPYLLIAYARSPDKNAEAYLRRVLKSEDRHQRLSAIHALEVLKQVDGSYEVRDMLSLEDGEEQPTEALQCVVVVSNLIDAMIGDGYSSIYAYHEVAELTRFDEELKRIENNAIRMKFLEAGKILGRVSAEGGFKDESEGVTVDDLPEEKQQRLIELDDAAFEDSQMLDDAVRIYIVDHADEFRGSVVDLR